MAGRKKFGERDHFVAWYEKASVRRSGRLVLLAEEDHGRLFFRPELVPALRHPLLIERGEAARQELLIRHLLSYLSFTEELEHEVVNRVAASLAKDKYRLSLPRHMESGAYKLYVDEGYHALFSAELKVQVADVTGIREASPSAPAFLEKLDSIRRSALPEMRWLVDVFFSIVSETLISGTLVDIPQDDRVVGAVRRMIAEHAADEAVHHTYFAGLLDLLWPRLSVGQQTAVGVLLPEFIIHFLEPDYAALARNLSALGLNPGEINSLIEECYPRSEVLRDIKRGSAVTLRYLKECGAFENERILKAFHAAGLL